MYSMIETRYETGLYENLYPLLLILILINRKRIDIDKCIFSNNKFIIITKSINIAIKFVIISALIFSKAEKIFLLPIKNYKPSN